MKVRAVQYDRSMQEGWSRPLLFGCNDGNKYVVKLMNNPQGLKVLPNEWIAYRLGRLLNLPVGKCAIVYISKELIKSFPALKARQVRAGPHFGSRYYKEAKPLNEANDLMGCENLSEAAGMIAFDHWIQNWDRADNTSNILVVEEGNRKKVMMIDHANAFTGYWTLESLKKNRKEPSAYWGKIYDLILPYIDHDRPFEEILAKIKVLNKVDFWTIMAEMPAEWLVSSIEQHKLVKYLDYRRSVVPEALGKLKKHFRHW